ncbi:ribonuclease Z [bacterium BMS3Abin05]|nr:ribonuclease Z [bacterium BMS3Abin05]
METYRIYFLLPESQISHMIDTAYFDGLLEDYKNADILILHVVRYENRNDRAKGIYHLNLDNAREIIKTIRPRVTVLMHFGMTMLQKKPWILAQQLSDEIGVDVKAASDGMTLDVGEYL